MGSSLQRRHLARVHARSRAGSQFRLFRVLTSSDGSMGHIHLVTRLGDAGNRPAKTNRMDSILMSCSEYLGTRAKKKYGQRITGKWLIIIQTRSPISARNFRNLQDAKRKRSTEHTRRS